MGDMGELFNEQHEATKKHRAQMLTNANTEGWTRHTDWHFSRVFDGKRMDWWPSGGKAKYNGRMIYGHKRVNAAICKLVAANA